MDQTVSCSHIGEIGSPPTGGVGRIKLSRCSHIGEIGSPLTSGVGWIKLSRVPISVRLAVLLQAV